MEKRRYALRLAYDGSAFRGFQRQPGLPTVQGALEEALSHLGARVRLEAAARTDAGVHAVAQVVTFSLREELDPVMLRAAVNAHTPAALLCLEAARVAPHVHARASACSRRYVYLVGFPAPAQLQGYAWSLPDPRAFPGTGTAEIDLERARSALTAVIGEHDFGGFARAGEHTARRRQDPRATVTTVTRAELIGASSLPVVAFVLEGRAFLRAMVRNIVGTVVSIGVGAADPSRVSEILASPAARYRGVRAPGWGLTLASVEYPHPIFPGAGLEHRAPRRRETPARGPAG